MATPAGSERPASTSVVRVRYAETDKMGVVYYANYFVWFEVGRADTNSLCSAAGTPLHASISTS